MNKHKNYHMYGILAIVVLILLIIFLSLYIGRNTNGSSASNASPPASSPGTDIIKDAGDDAEVTAYLEEQDTIISDMLGNMRVKESGSAELDFLISMIPHYEASIDLSKNYLILGGKDKRLKELAKEIIGEHLEEIENMRELIKEIQKQDITDSEKEKKYLKVYNKIISSHKNISDETNASSNVEEAYIEGMVIHHQMASDMAETILKYSSHREICNIAEDIFETQKEETSKMEEIFNDM
ncbi:MAG: DUF305 domain-containing protein [Lachnospiraceae bacterium]|nr:DUF305 domain-containing protein [Lachnospiraceae bacterium]